MASVFVILRNSSITKNCKNVFKQDVGFIESGLPLLPIINLRMQLIERLLAETARPLAYRRLRTGSIEALIDELTFLSACRLILKTPFEIWD